VYRRSKNKLSAINFFRKWLVSSKIEKAILPHVWAWKGLTYGTACALRLKIMILAFQF